MHPSHMDVCKIACKLACLWADSRFDVYLKRQLRLCVCVCLCEWTTLCCVWAWKGRSTITSLQEHQNTINGWHEARDRGKERERWRERKKKSMKMWVVMTSWTALKRLYSIPESSTPHSSILETTSMYSRNTLQQFIIPQQRIMGDAELDENPSFYL